MKKLILFLMILQTINIQAQIVSYAMGRGCFPEQYYHEVWAVAMAPDRVYLGGLMNKMINADGTEVTVNKICWYDWQGNYHPMGLGALVSWYTGVYALGVETNGRLWAGGGFYEVANDNGGGSVPDTKYLAVWENNAWHTPPFTVDGVVYAIYIAPNGNVYVGGDFEHATQNGNSLLVMGLVRWDGAQIHRVSGGVDVGDYKNGVRTIIMDNLGNLVVGGGFPHAFDDDGNGGGTAVDGTKGIAKLVNNHWQPLGNGVSGGYILSLAIDADNNIYVGHDPIKMLNSDGLTVPYTEGIAKWDGIAWQSLGHGVNNAVYAVKISNDDAYVGGWFTEVYRADGSVVMDGQYFVKWKIAYNAWTSLTAYPPDSTVRALDFRDGKMVVGGVYSSLGGTSNTYSVCSITDADNPLPVELTTFSASIVHNKVQLSWTTATEVNNYGFEIEKSDNKINWQNIGFVKGNGNSNAPKHYSFTDNEIGTGKYFYRLKQIDIDGKYKYSRVVELDMGMPKKYDLSQNYPNPFNPTTTIKYSIPVSPVGDENFRPVQLKIYDILGKEVTTLVNKNQAPGNYTVNFDASDLPSGIYFYRITAGSFTETKKMILLR